jgi:hypothetical protein
MWIIVKSPLRAGAAIGHPTQPRTHPTVASSASVVEAIHQEDAAGKADDSDRKGNEKRLLKPWANPYRAALGWDAFCLSARDARTASREESIGAIRKTA